MTKPIPKILVYRIVHFNNLTHILKHGIAIKGHGDMLPEYINIGNSEIIQSRDLFPVKIKDYGYIGDYIPFYWGTQSIMLYNILTGLNGVQKQLPNDIVYICCFINDLINNCSKFFFTDGQANKKFTKHFNDLTDLDNIDWKVVNGSDFKKTEADIDLPRRYQAEFLAHQYLPVSCINSLVVYDENRKKDIQLLLADNELEIEIKVAKKDFYIYF